MTVFVEYIIMMLLALPNRIVAKDVENGAVTP